LVPARAAVAVDVEGRAIPASTFLKYESNGSNGSNGKSKRTRAFVKDITSGEAILPFDIVGCDSFHGLDS
jgi:hypothetical protein